jgi:hypothetical protein
MGASAVSARAITVAHWVAVACIKAPVLYVFSS